MPHLIKYIGDIKKVTSNFKAFKKRTIYSCVIDSS